jgi:hypothetical protein
MNDWKITRTENEASESTGSLRAMSVLLKRHYVSAFKRHSAGRSS